MSRVRSNRKGSKVACRKKQKKGDSGDTHKERRRSKKGKWKPEDKQRMNLNGRKRKENTEGKGETVAYQKRSCITRDRDKD